jgi:hypothetical protein
MALTLDLLVIALLPYNEEFTDYRLKSAKLTLFFSGEVTEFAKSST